MTRVGWHFYAAMGFLGIAAFAAWLSHGDAGDRLRGNLSNLAELLVDDVQRAAESVAPAAAPGADQALPPSREAALVAAVRQQVVGTWDRLASRDSVVVCLLNRRGDPLFCRTPDGVERPPMTGAALQSGPAGIRSVAGWPFQVAVAADRWSLVRAWAGEFARDLGLMLAAAVLAASAALLGRRGVRQAPTALPRSASPGAEGRLEPDTVPHDREQHGPLLLVVDDDPIVCEFIAACLGDDYVIQWASDGREGCQKALDHQPDLILVDEVMPVSGGSEMIRLLRSDSSFDEVPIIMMTACRDRQLQPTVLRLGAQDFVPKPLDREVLRARVERLLRDRNRMAARLAASAHRLTALLEASQDAVLVVDDRHTVVVGNTSAAALLQRSADDLVGLSVRSLLAPQSWGPYLRACRSTSQPAAWQHRAEEQIDVLMSGGRRLPLRCSVAGCVDVTRRTFYSLVLRSALDAQRAGSNAATDLNGVLLADMQARQAQIARELHDSVASSLAGVSLLLGGAQALADASTEPLLSRAQVQIRDMAEQVRKISRGVLTDVGPAPLAVCLEQIAHDVSSSGAAYCVVRERGRPREQSTEVRTNVYRVAQEAVNNAIRHGRARGIRITLLHGEDGRSRLIVRDNGRGFDFSSLAHEHPGVGLDSMRARAALIGGTLRLQGSRGRGCVVRLTWPGDTPVGIERGKQEVPA